MLAPLMPAAGILVCKGVENHAVVDAGIFTLQQQNTGAAGQKKAATPAVITPVLTAWLSPDILVSVYLKGILHRFGNRKLNR
jgi:hypothetical protein